MAVQTGTSTDWKDLLADLKTFVEAQGWITESYTTGAGAEDPDTLYLRGAGPTGTEDVHVNIRTTADTTNGIYAWEVRGAITYSSALSYENQPGVSPATFMLLWQNSIDYWFYVNDRRIIVIAKVSTTYRTMYAGFYLPHASPAEYPYPLYVASDYDTAVIYTTTNSGIRSFVDPGIDAAHVRTPDGVWRRVYNHDNITSNADDFEYHYGADYYVWPYFAGGQSINVYPEHWYKIDLRPIEGEAGTGFFVPANITGATQDAGWLGAIQGAVWVPGFGVAAEQTFVYGGDTYRIFPNIDRNDSNHFFAIQEV